MPLPPSGESVALYWDFENLHASLVDQRHGPGTYRATRFTGQEELIDVAAIVELALSLGPVAINRAFANWVSFNRYRIALLQSAVELIQVFSPGANAKNGADIKLCLDVMDDMARFPHVGTIVVVGGDSDYMPLSYKVKAAGRTLVGIGSQASTNQHWARSCHEFLYYETLLAAPALDGDDARDPADAAEAVNEEELRELLDRADQAARRQRRLGGLVQRAVSLLSGRHGDGWVPVGGLRPVIRRLDPTFHEAAWGFDSFPTLLASLGEVLELRRGAQDDEVRLLRPQGPAAV